MNNLDDLNDYQIDELLLKRLEHLKSAQHEFDLIWEEKSRRESIRRQKNAEKGANHERILY